MFVRQFTQVQDLVGLHHRTGGFVQDPLPMAVPYGPLPSPGPAGSVRAVFDCWAWCPSISWAVRPLLSAPSDTCSHSPFTSIPSHYVSMLGAAVKVRALAMDFVIC